MLQDGARLMEVLGGRQEQILLVGHQQRALLSAEVVVADRRRCRQFCERRKAMLVTDLLEVELRKWLGNPLCFEESRQRFVVAAADVLQGLRVHQVAAVRLHLLLLQL